MKDGCVLRCAQFRQLDDLAIRQFERVMVDARLVLIHLPKPGHLVREPFETEAIGGLALKMFFKGKLCAGKQATLARQRQRNPACQS